MGFVQGRQWTRIRKGFKSALSPQSADSSLISIEESLQDWENFTLKPLCRSGEIIDIKDVVGMMPITIMLNIFFGQSFTKRFSNELTDLTNDARFIGETAIHNKWAASSFYKFFDNKANR